MKIFPVKYPGWDQYPCYKVNTIADFIELETWTYNNQVKYFLLSSGYDGYTFQVKSNHELFYRTWFKLPIKVALPFSMGRVVKVNPITFEETIVHPVMEVGSSWSYLKPTVVKWLNENIGQEHVHWSFKPDNTDNCVWFLTQEDATLFMLSCV